MAKSDMRKHIDTYQELPSDVILGSITWYTINDGQYVQADIEKWFDDLGLSPAFVPPSTRAIGAYEKASTDAAKIKPYPLANNTWGSLLTREVFRDTEQVIRHVVREVRDSDRKRLRFDTIAELILFRPVIHNGKTDQASYRLRVTLHEDRLLTGEKTIMEQVIAQFTTDFDGYFNFIDGNKVRGVVRDYLGFLNAVMMKSGVYFVHKTRSEELVKLQEFTAKLGNGCLMELMPIPELKRLREAVVAAFQEEAVKELEEVVAAISKVRATRATITAAALAKLTDQYQTVMRKANEYTRTLKVNQDHTAGAAEVALESLDALREDMRKQMEKA